MPIITPDGTVQPGGEDVGVAAPPVTALTAALPRLEGSHVSPTPLLEAALEIGAPQAVAGTFPAGDYVIPGILIIETAGGEASNEAAVIIRTANNTNSTAPATLRLLRSRGTTEKPLIIGSGDRVGRISVQPHDGVTDAEQQCAAIHFEMDGTPAAGDLPGRIVFLTTQGGAALSTEALRIDSSQVVTFAGVLSVDDTTDSTSGTTGSIHTDGGLGVAKALFVGTTLTVAGVGPHVIGGTMLDYIQMRVTGSFQSLGASTLAAGLLYDGTITGASGDTTRLTGVEINPAVNTQVATETVAYIASLRVDEPSIQDNLTGDITVASTVHIVRPPSEGEDNYALHVDEGTSRFDGTGTTAAPVNIPHGSAPTSPVDGDVWTTTAGLFVRVNGSTVGPLS